MSWFDSLGGGGLFDSLSTSDWSKPEWGETLGGAESFQQPYPARPEEEMDWEKWGEYLGARKSPEMAQAPQLPQMQSPYMGMNMMGQFGQQPRQNIGPAGFGGPIGQYTLGLLEI